MTGLVWRGRAGSLLFRHELRLALLAAGFVPVHAPKAKTETWVRLD